MVIFKGVKKRVNNNTWRSTNRAEQYWGRSLQMQILDAHELAAEAIVKSGRDLLLRAFCTDPLINSIPDAREMIAEALQEEKEAMAEEWYK